MGMLNDYELTASYLAGGLGVARERLFRSMGRLNDHLPKDALGDPESIEPDCRGPSYAAAVSQALSDLTDAWQRSISRPARFKETERLFLLLKDKALGALTRSPDLWKDYAHLAQSLSELKLDGGRRKSRLQNLF
ncbi:MAG: hypothetical protein LBV23_10065 [Deltaproteobacteria bacterium]|jgi:hypothetical protein|nr:hypothetical protein [Deltaproteobacteria bacterium]